MMDSRFGEAALTMTLAALVFGFATAAHAQGKWRAGPARSPLSTSTKSTSPDNVAC